MAYTPTMTAADIWKMRQQREQEEKIDRARALFNQGMSLYEIANKVGLPERVLVSELEIG